MNAYIYVAPNWTLTHSVLNNTERCPQIRCCTVALNDIVVTFMRPVISLVSECGRFFLYRVTCVIQ